MILSIYLVNTMVGEISDLLSSALDVPTNCYTVEPASDPSDSSRSSQWLKQCSDNLAALDEEHLLVISPYTSRRHLLPLHSIGKPQRLLAKAFTVMAPIRDDYATAPYSDAFNWDLVISVLRSLVETESYAWKHQLFYIVVFRSQISPTIDRSHLTTLDERSHAEAMESGGLLKYWFGIPDINGRNMATCKSLKELRFLRRGS